jgi:hypothetical protein
LSGFVAADMAAAIASSALAIRSSAAGAAAGFGRFVAPLPRLPARAFGVLREPVFPDFLAIFAFLERALLVRAWSRKWKPVFG